MSVRVYVGCVGVYLHVCCRLRVYACLFTCVPVYMRVYCVYARVLLVCACSRPVVLRVCVGLCNAHVCAHGYACVCVIVLARPHVGGRKGRAEGGGTRVGWIPAPAPCAFHMYRTLGVPENKRLIPNEELSVKPSVRYKTDDPGFQCGLYSSDAMQACGSVSE